MARLTILHISDAHWSKKNQVSQRAITDALIDDLAVLRQRDISPNLVIFSGDLVQAGEEHTDFEDALNAVLKPIVAACNLPEGRLFVAPGNHDISRKIARDQAALEKGLISQLINDEEISKFVAKYNAKSDLEVLALKRLEGFYNWHDALFPNMISNGLFSRSSSISISGKKVGIVLLNSAWRATGESGDVDDGNLIVGSSVVDASVKTIADCDYKIAVQHHPFEYFCQFERESSKNACSKAFDLICMGHTHHPRPERVEDVFGSSVRSQAGSFYAGSRWFNGYQIVDIDFVQNTTSIYCREYFPVRKIFSCAANLIDADPFILNYAIKNQCTEDNLELFLKQNKKSILNLFVEHLNFGRISEVKDEDVLEGYACPKLFIQTQSKIDESLNISESYRRANIEEFLKSTDNIIFHGPRQTGKTSLKLHLAHRLSHGIGCAPKIPILIDVEKFQWNEYGIRKSATSIFDFPTNFDLTKSLEDGSIVFLFEDIGRLDQDGLEKLASFVIKYKACRCLLFGCPDEHSLSKERHFRKSLSDFLMVGLGELTRSSIRKMTNSWFSDGQEAKDNFELVVSQVNRDGLPRTAYMVGLLLWAAKQGQKGNRLNEAILLQNVLDHLLDKANFRFAKRGALTTRGKELLLTDIANRFDSYGSRARSAEVISWVDQYFQKKRLNYDSSEVVSELINCGILRKIDGNIEYRYRCFQEYYIAQGMLDTKDCHEKTDGLKFLKRGREIELLSGLQGENAPIIENILDVLTSRMPRDLTDVLSEDFGKRVYGSSQLSVTREKVRKIRKTRLTEEQIDQVMEAIDERATSRGDRPVTESWEESGGDVVSAATKRQTDAVQRDVSDDSDFLRPGTFMAGLSILARVLRNSDYTDYDVKGPALNTLLDSWCRIHVLLDNEVRWVLKEMESAQDEKLENEEFETLVKMMSKVMFAWTASAVTSELSTPSLVESMHELESEGKLVDGKRLLSLVLLEDADDPTWPNRWKNVIDDPDAPAFDIDFLVDRLWRNVNRKALDEDQDKRVGKVVDAIEARFNWGNEKKSSVLENIREMATIQRIGDN